jgi:hypothetical protein
MAASAPASSGFSAQIPNYAASVGGLPQGTSVGINGITVPQGTASATAPGGAGTLPGNTYQGYFGNTVQSLPIVGGTISNLLSSLYGTKYGVPDPTATAGQAASGNVGNLGVIGQETMGADTISAQGAALPYQMNLPNYEGMLQTATGNASQDLSGQVPQDVQNLLSQQAAERGVTTGQGVGSPDSSAAYLQSLGLTSLGMEQQGQQDFNQLFADTPTGSQFNPGSGFVTPSQEQAAQLASNEEAAAPDPQMAGLMNTFGSVIGGMI